MKAKSIISALTGLGLLAMIGASPVLAEEGGATPHFPLAKPKEQHWSFAGPFGKWDIGQLQRGLKVYKEVCSSCHTMHLVPFRSLSALGYDENQIKAFAAEYEVTDGPNDQGEMFTRPGKPSDKFQGPYANVEAAAAANNGAAPPDFSLIAKARGVERGFPTFVFDIFTLYAENGPDYIYSLLTGFDQKPEAFAEHLPKGFTVPEGGHFNPYFMYGASLAMAPPLSNDVVTYDDGTPQTVDQYARDISAFLMWAAEPSLVQRKEMGFKVLIFLALFAALAYLSKKKLFAGLRREE